MLAEQRADPPDHSGTIRVFQHEHNAVRSSFNRSAVDTHNSWRGAEKCAADRNGFAFAHSGKFEHVGVITWRTQSRFAHFQTESFSKCGRIYFIDLVATGNL